VVQGAILGAFHIHLQGDDGLPSIRQSERFCMSEFAGSWIPHPDPSVDLCMLPIGGLLEQANRAGRVARR